MTRTTVFAVVAMGLLGGCMSSEPMAGRAHNDMLRFSSMNYTLVSDSVE